MVAAGTGRGQQDAGFDACVGNVDSCAVVTGVIGAEQHARGLAAERVTSHGHAAPVEASPDRRDSVLDEIELIQDLPHVADAGLLERRSAWR